MVLGVVAATVFAIATTMPAAVAGPSPSPAPPTQGSNAPAKPGSAKKAQRATCTEDPKKGLPVNCQEPVPASKLPAGAKDTAAAPAAITDPATMVDTRTWTTGGGNTFPGAEVPFGMVQWSPDTMPGRNAGGGYSFGESSITGYSLTHVSGPGCGAAGDVPMLPVTGPLPSGDPNNVQSGFTNTNEVAQAGYYSAQSNQPNTITSEFTATAHSSMARFTYPATTQAGYLIKLQDSQNGQFAPSTATVVNNHEIAGSETSGEFCGESNNDGQVQHYTVHFDITFDQPFTASQVLGDSSNPSAVYLTFDTTSNPVVQAKVGISYVSDANAQLNWQTENPGWNFAATKAAAQSAWNGLLGRIDVSGGSVAQTQQFYSNLYKVFVQPNITSDVNGQYMGADFKVQHVVKGQDDQYGIFSGWDTYHSAAELQAMLDPKPASDQAQSLLNYYSQDKILQQWGYLNLNNYVMVGDPAQSIIADYYAFGAKNFDTATALKDMLAQATTTNDVRPGEALEQKYGYLPEDGTYGCCNPHGYVPTLLEYDSEDLALSFFARALGDKADADMLQGRANNWQHVFDLSNNLLNGRNEDGSFVPGITPTSSTRYVEGSAFEYLWNVPNNYAALFSLLGGNSKVAPMLRDFLSQPDAGGMNALLTNEFGFGEQYALNYAGDPAGTQQAVNNIRNTMYKPGPSGLADNDDLGANSSAFVWEMLGMYPENSGNDTMVFNGPGFPHATITLPSGRAITINAPGASPSTFYVHNLKINGDNYGKLYVPFSQLSKGATLDWTLGTTPGTWGTTPASAPPSYQQGLDSVVTSVDPGSVVLQPGASTTATLTAASIGGKKQTVTWTATADNGLTVSPAQGSLSVSGTTRASAKLNVTAGANVADGRYHVTFQVTAGTEHHTVSLGVAVAKPGELWPYFTNAGITDDSNTSAATYDGGGWSYSAQALAASPQHVTPGSTLTVDGIDYTWPDVPVATLDNIEANGQTIPLAAPAHSSVIGLLGSATNAGSAGAGGTATITYTDGTTSQFNATFSDWTLGAGGFPPVAGNIDAVSMPYRNFSGNTTDHVVTHVFAMEAPVNVAKTVASITLPQATGGDMHVFAITLPPAPAHAVTATPANQKGAGKAGADATYTVQLTNAGYEPDSYMIGSTSTWPASVYAADCTTPLTTTATVQPGDSTNLCVKVGVPSSAADGDSSDTTLTATSAADSSVTATTKLTSIAVTADTLIVDEDGGGPNVESYYENALKADNVAYSYWDLAADSTLPLSMLTTHKTVVWFTGNSYPGPITPYESELGTFLDGGGRLFMSGQDILDQQAGTTAFVHNYLHINWDGSETQNDKPTADVHGVAGSAVTDGIGAIPLDHSVLNASFEDQITPIAPATAAFTDDSSATDGLSVSAGAYKVVFLAFPFEAYGTATDKADLMNRVLSYLS